MLREYFQVWMVLYKIDYITFLKITGFAEDYYSEQKFTEFKDDYTTALLSYDRMLRNKFDVYIQKQVDSIK